MATVNFSRREILCKIVYYGPGLCGKTTNLQSIHAKMPENLRGNLTSVATKQDRTLFFDLLPLELGKVKDFTIRLQLYTVPGQVYYNASRKIVLKGVDGVVFVADSQRGKMTENQDSLKNLGDNLRENGADPSQIPIVLQFNKRDLAPVYTVEELNQELNPNNLGYFEAIATTGQGVFNTLKRITELVVTDIKSRLEAAERVPAAPAPAAPTPPKPPMPAPAAAPVFAPASSAPVAPAAAAPAPPLPPAPIPAPAMAKPVAVEEIAGDESDREAGRKGFWGKITGVFKKTGK